LKNAYCPVSKKTGLCGDGWLLGPAGPALKGAGKLVTRVSGMFPPIVTVLVVALMIATEPPSHMLA
jgi:hypothetical protein